MTILKKSKKNVLNLKTKNDIKELISMNQPLSDITEKYNISVSTYYRIRKTMKNTSDSNQNKNIDKYKY